LAIAYMLASRATNYAWIFEKGVFDKTFSLRWVIGALFSSKFMHTKTPLKVGLSISRTNADSQWNPVYNAFHRIFVVQTNRFVGTSLNVMLTRQTCGQRSSRATERNAER